MYLDLKLLCKNRLEGNTLPLLIASPVCGKPYSREVSGSTIRRSPNLAGIITPWSRHVSLLIFAPETPFEFVRYILLQGHIMFL